MPENEKKTLELTPLEGGYFYYCQYCIYDGKCQLKHNEFTKRYLPDEGCDGRIMWNQKNRIYLLFCAKCQKAIITSDTCRKYKTDYPRGELPPPREDYRAVVRF